MNLVQLLPLAIALGIGATLFMDVGALIQRQFFQQPTLNYCMVGRWLGHFPKGKFIHERIDLSPHISGECVIGWVSHYLIGITFAGLLLGIWGIQWAQHPQLLPALFVGILTIAAPFLIMQPGMGAGFAASKTPNPMVSRWRSLLAHTTYGLGLYLAALLIAQFLH